MALTSLKLQFSGGEGLGPNSRKVDKFHHSNVSFNVI